MQQQQSPRRPNRHQVKGVKFVRETASQANPEDLTRMDTSQEAVKVHPGGRARKVWKDLGATREVAFDGRRLQEPKMVRSVSTTTITDQPVTRPVVQGHEYHLDYDGAAFAENILFSHLSRHDVFQRARLHLAFFRFNKDLSIDLNSYVAGRIYLTSSGLPGDDDELERVYYRFCSEKGLNRELVEKDLANVKAELSSKNLAHKNSARKNFEEFHGLRTHRDQGSRSQTAPPAGCDPECVIL